MTISQLSHIQEQRILTSRVRDWMLRNYQRHLSDDGTIDTETLAEQAAAEFCCTRQMADDLAKMVRAKMDEGATAI